MANAIWTSRTGTRARAHLGHHGQQTGTVGQEVHDGDTISVALAGDFGVRFLGVDAPEVSYHLPGEDNFVGIARPQWAAFLADPFAAALPPFTGALSRALIEHVRARCGPDTASNHAAHARAATLGLRAQITADIAALGQTNDSFRFFLAFAHEVTDGYGRLLAYINRHQDDPDQPTPRPDSYNERLLAQGLVSAYFIWPNLDPYRRQPSLIDAVPAPGAIRPAGAPAEAERPLDQARAAVRAARQQRLGLYGDPPLQLHGFELRFLADRRPPHRSVIDLSTDEPLLLPPQRYLEIAHPEDRLFIPAEYVPLFVEHGWQRGDEDT